MEVAGDWGKWHGWEVRMKHARSEGDGVCRWGKSGGGVKSRVRGEKYRNGREKSTC